MLHQKSQQTKYAGHFKKYCKHTNFGTRLILERRPNVPKLECSKNEMFEYFHYIYNWTPSFLVHLGGLLLNLNYAVHEYYFRFYFKYRVKVTWLFSIHHSSTCCTWFFIKPIEINQNYLIPFKTCFNRRWIQVMFWYGQIDNTFDN